MAGEGRHASRAARPQLMAGRGSSCVYVGMRRRLRVAFCPAGAGSAASSAQRKAAGAAAASAALVGGAGGILPEHEGTKA